MKLLDNLSNLRYKAGNFFLRIIKEEEYLRNKDIELKTKSKDSILGTNIEAYKFRKCSSPRINSLKVSKALYLQTATVLLVKCL
jgi:hypothetical protein